MTKNSNEEIAKLLKATGGNSEEQAAALAVTSALLAQTHSSVGKQTSDWNSEMALREGLRGTWRSQITI